MRNISVRTVGFCTERWKECTVIVVDKGNIIGVLNIFGDIQENKFVQQWMIEIAYKIP